MEEFFRRSCSVVTLLVAFLSGTAFGSEETMEKPLHPSIKENLLEAKRALPTYECRKVTGPLGADGFPTKEAWKKIPSTGNFWLFDGSQEARFRTEAKLCWSESHLYIAFDCEDPKISATRTERDSDVYSEDVVEVFISPWADTGHYYEINVNPLNTLFDAEITNRVEELGLREGLTVGVDWNCRDIRTAIERRPGSGENWSAKYAIPFASFAETPFNPPKPGVLWRMNLYRIEGVPQTDFYAWSPNWFKFPAFHVSRGFGWLKFLE